MAEKKCLPMLFWPIFLKVDILTSGNEVAQLPNVIGKDLRHLTDYRKGRFTIT